MRTLAAIASLLREIDEHHQLGLEVYLDPARPRTAHTLPGCTRLGRAVPAELLDCRSPQQLRLCLTCEERLEEASFTEHGARWSPHSIHLLWDLLSARDRLTGLAAQVRSLSSTRLTLESFAPSTQLYTSPALELPSQLISTLHQLDTLELSLARSPRSSPLLRAALWTVRSPGEAARDQLRTQLSGARELLLQEMRQRASQLRGATELLELEEDEVLIGYRLSPGYRADPLPSLLALVFGVGGNLPTVVLRAPRFLTPLLTTSTGAWVDTAPAPQNQGACEIAAALWDPTLPGGLASLVAAARTAQETLTLAS